MISKPATFSEIKGTNIVILSDKYVDMFSVLDTIRIGWQYGPFHSFVT